VAVAALAGLCGPLAAPATADVPDWDVVVVGASSGGVGAAMGAARHGARVLVVESSTRPGGMLTNGVTTDMFDVRASSGAFERFRLLVAAAYATHPDRARARDGLVAEPDVALRAVQRLLDHPDVTVRTGWRLTGARVEGDEVRAITVTDGTRREELTAGTFVDATPEGDLLGAAGREGRDWVVGREAAATYDERLAPAVGDRRQQAYNYRFTVQVGGRTDYRVPATYAADALRFRRMDRSTPGQHRCSYPDRSGRVRTYQGIRLQRCMPNGKMDVNLDLVGINHTYPTDSPLRRARTEARLRDVAINYLHYVRTVLGHRELGLTDDYAENGGFPVVPYVREGRRLLGRDVFTMHDARPVAGSDRPAPEARSVATGDYGMDSHCVGPANHVSGQPGCTGSFWMAVAPYQISYDVMVPTRLRRLLAPVPVSGSHVGYSTLRMEPVRMNLGYAAGVAAALSASTRTLVGDVDVTELQRRLVADRQYVVWFRDLPPTAPDFAAVQLAHVGSSLPMGMLVPR
jgi:hypothetical protein